MIVTCWFLQISREHHFAVILIEFAFQLMLLLDQINKESFQVTRKPFSFRYGISLDWKMIANKSKTTWWWPQCPPWATPVPSEGTFRLRARGRCLLTGYVKRLTHCRKLKCTVSVYEDQVNKSFTMDQLIYWHTLTVSLGCWPIGRPCGSNSWLSRPIGKGKYLYTSFGMLENSSNHQL